MEKNLLAAIIPQENGNPDRDGNPAVDGPLDFAGHEASGKDIDSLQKPDCPRQRQHRTEDIEPDFHEHYLLQLRNSATIIPSSPGASFPAGTGFGFMNGISSFAFLR